MRAALVQCSKSAPVGIHRGHAPLSGGAAGELGCIKRHRICMIGVHVGNDVGLRLDQGAGIGNVGAELPRAASRRSCRSRRCSARARSPSRRWRSRQSGHSLPRDGWRARKRRSAVALALGRATPVTVSLPPVRGSPRPPVPSIRMLARASCSRLRVCSARREIRNSGRSRRLGCEQDERGVWMPCLTVERRQPCLERRAHAAGARRAAGSRARRLLLQGMGRPAWEIPRYLWHSIVGWGVRDHNRLRTRRNCHNLRTAEP